VRVSVMDVGESLGDQDSGPAVSELAAGAHGESLCADAFTAAACTAAEPPAHNRGTQGVGIANLRILDRLAVEGSDRIGPLPFMLRVLVAAAVTPGVAAPVCIVLPDVDGVAEIVAAIVSLITLQDEWPQLRERFLREELQRGVHLRSVADGKIIGFLGIDDDFVRLRYVDAEGAKTKAALLIPSEMVFGLEPTERKRPIFKSGEKPQKPLLTTFDLVAGTRTFGNTGIIRNRIILLGSAQRFQDALKQAAIIAAGDFNGAKVRAFKKFVWGHLDESRKAIVTNPYGTTGEPLVAVTQDVLLLQRAPSGESHSGKILISGRFELVRRNLETVRRFGDGNRIVVFAPAERRDEARRLRESGWFVWEPGGGEMRAGDSRVRLRGLPGVSRSLRSLYADLRQPSFSTISARSDALREAFEHLRALGHVLPSDEAEMDRRLEEIRHGSSDLFFSISSWLGTPGPDDVEHAHGLISVLKNNYQHAEQCLGTEGARHITSLLQCVERFVVGLDGSAMTPKGAALLGIAQRVWETSQRHAFVTDFATDRDRVTRFLEKNGHPDHQCLTIQALRDAKGIFQIIAFGLVRQEGFARFVDPWPGRDVTFAGYDYEIEVYERRLAQRSRLRNRLGLDDGPRSQITGLAPTDFGPRQYVDQNGGSGAAPDPQDAVLSGLDRAAGSRRTTPRRPVLARRPGELTIQARYMSFCGTSWAAFTEEHEVLAIRGLIGTTSTVIEMDVPDLAVGTRIIIRESGDKDVIREMAEHEIGESAYTALRERAALWKCAIRQSNLEPQQIVKRLARVGVNRSLATIRGWLNSESRIGPRSKADVIGISEAFPLEGASDRRWEDCASAIADVRGLHLSVGAKLTGILARQCQNVLIDAGEHEQRVELDFGAVWIVEIAEIDDAVSDWPVSSVNRLNWFERPATTTSLDELVGGLR